MNQHASTLRKLNKVACRQRILEESRLSFADVGGFYRYANSRVEALLDVGSLVVGDRTLVRWILRERTYVT